MGRIGRIAATGRAIIGVIALYGLLLQGFLAASVPVATIARAGVLCAAHDGAGQGSPETPARHDHACCTVAQAGGIAPPPVHGASLAGSPPRVIATVWRPENALPATGPPTDSHSARGPPSA